MDFHLQEIKIVLEEEKIEESSEKFDMTYSEWKDRFEKLAYYIEHDELEKVETSLVALKSNIDTKENEQAIEEIDEAVFLLEHIRNKDELNLKNIF